MCLISQKNVAIFKQYSTGRHFSRKDAETVSNMSTHTRDKASTLVINHYVFVRQAVCQGNAAKASYTLLHKITKYSSHFSEGEFLEDCMIEAALVWFIWR